MKMSVSMAEAYRPGGMSSLGNASNMFMRQFLFPLQYDVNQDILTSADSDRLLGWDYKGFRATLQKFVGTGEGAIGSWVRREYETGQEATDEVVLEFIKEALKVKENHPGVNFSGWRVTGTVNLGNGFPVYTLSLFANRSGVKVYSDESAPNVEPVSIPKMLGISGSGWYSKEISG
jgi:hypothetical protein